LNTLSRRRVLRKSASRAGGSEFLGRNEHDTGLS
jgi:hypothetical protein